MLAYVRNHNTISGVRNIDQQNPYFKTGCLKIRHLIVLLLALGLFTSCATSGAMSYTIIAMAAPLPEPVSINSTSHSECPGDRDNSTSTSSTDGTLQWSQETRTLLVNALMWGYVCSQIPIGYLSEKVNRKRMIGLAIVGNTCISALIPVVAVWNVKVLIALQAANGFFQGTFYPPTVALMARWVVDQERSTMNAIMLSGPIFCQIILPIVSTQLSEHGFAGGWPSVFYVGAMIGVVWLILWNVLATNTPEQHRCITQKELEYIVQNRLASPDKAGPLNWKAMLTSFPVWMVCVAAFSTSWPQQVLTAELPSYMNFPLNFSVQQVGYFSSAINIGSAIILILSGIVADSLQYRQVLKTPTIRKLFIVSGGLVTTLCLALLPLAGCNKVAVSVLALVCIGAINFNMNASQTTAMEIAPKFAGTVAALWNFCGALNSPLSALVVTLETRNEVTLRTWSAVYYISAGVSIVGTLLFLLFGSATAQPWATEKSVEDESQSPTCYGTNE